MPKASASTHTGMTDAESREFAAEARRVFGDWEQADIDNRRAAVEALRFQALLQYTQQEIAYRTAMRMPSFVVDICGPFVRSVDGRLRKNPPQATIYPAEGGDAETAAVLGGMHRSDCRLSFSDQVFSAAIGQAAACGMGSFRLSLEYESPRSNLRVLRYRSITNPLAVICDPDATFPDEGDATGKFVFQDMSRRAFKARFGEEAAWTDWASDNLVGLGGWATRESTRLAEYWTIEHRPAVVTTWTDGHTTVDISPEAREQRLMAGLMIHEERKSQLPGACMYLMTGAEVLRKHEWPGVRIPVFTVRGEEVNIDGRTYRRGIIGGLIDTQKIRNYSVSDAVKTVSMGTLQKWLGTVDQFKGFEGIYDNANGAATQRLPYNPDPRAPGPPQRIAPPEANRAAMELASESVDWAKTATGQFAESLGEDQTAKSGRAINALQAAADVGTYLYIDKGGVQLEAAAREYVEIAPHVYDSERMVRTLGKDMRPAVMRVNDGVIDLHRGRYDLTYQMSQSFDSQNDAARAGIEAQMQNPASAPFIDILIEEWWKRTDVDGAPEVAAKIRQRMAQQSAAPGPGAQTGAPSAPGGAIVPFPGQGGPGVPGGAQGAPAAPQIDLPPQFAYAGGDPFAG